MQSVEKSVIVEIIRKVTQHVHRIGIQLINVGCCNVRNAKIPIRAIRSAATNVINK